MIFDGYAIVSDLDGTLLDKNKNVSQRNIDAINYFNNNGGLFTIATGRDVRFIRRKFSNLVPLLNAPSILSNGAYVYDFNNDLTYKELKIKCDSITFLLEKLYAEFPDLSVEIATKNSFYVINPDTFFDDRFSDMMDLVEYKFEPFIPQDEILRVLCIETDAEKLREVSEYILHLDVSKDFEFVFSETIMFEIMPIGSKKGNGIDELRKIFDKKTKIISVGDYYNDLSQLEKADLAVCPENAAQDIKDFCMYTLCDCNVGVIADIVEGIENKKFVF